MLQFSKIDKDLTIFNQKRVFLYGASKSGLHVKNILDRYEINIEAYIDSDPTKHNTYFDGKPIISLDDFIKYHASHDYIIQISSTYENEISHLLSKNNITDFITYSEFLTQTSCLNMYSTLQLYPSLKSFLYNDCNWKVYYTNDYTIYLNAILDKKESDPLYLLFSAPKTGNETIQASAKQCFSTIFPLNHTSAYLSPEVKEYIKNNNKIKIIIGTRDPIMQNISLLFQLGGSQNIFWDCPEYWEPDGVNKVFNKYLISDLNLGTCYHILRNKANTNYLIQDFFETQINPFLGINIYDYPFNQNDGYTIYNIGKYEILIYQLEKINSLEKVFSDFLENPNFKYVIKNKTESKWYHPYYKTALEKIVLEKDYFEKCYSSMYATHFYSDSDITKFKKRWISHII